MVRKNPAPSRSRKRAGTTRRPLSSRLWSTEPVNSGRSIRTSTGLHYDPLSTTIAHQAPGGNGGRVRIFRILTCLRGTRRRFFHPLRQAPRVRAWSGRRGRNQIASRVGEERRFFTQTEPPSIPNSPSQVPNAHPSGVAFMKKLLAFAFAAFLLTTRAAFADDATTAAQDAKIKALEVQMDYFSRQLEILKAQKAAPPPAAAVRPTQAPGIYKKPGDPLTFTNGGADEVTLYGNLDLSLDHPTKGRKNFYPSSGDSPTGNVSWQSAVSTNLSYIGVRGLHKLGKKSNVVYQLETQLDISATSGTVFSNSNNDNVVKDALTSRNSFLGLSTPIGTFRVGKTDAPYKNSTARMNPFNGELGDYAVIMGNSGGDNRVEFGTRLDHSLWWDSHPSWGGTALSILVSPGQNRSSDNGITASGESGCAGGNAPGSGAGAFLCIDGAFSSD